MKTLKTYIHEALISSKNKVKSKLGNLYKFDKNLSEKYDIDIDNSIDTLVNDYDIETLGKCITNVKIPIAKWYIYRDKYHGNQPHISTYLDMCAQFLYFPADFEDFNPEDILFSANTLQEIFDYCCNEIGVNINSSDVESLAEDIVEKLDLIDSEDFIYTNINNTEQIEKETEHEKYDNQSFEEIVEWLGF